MKEFKPDFLLNSPDDFISLESFKSEYLETKSVLGIDIYKYSQYALPEQFFIPVLFEKLYENSIKNVLEREKFIFGKYANNIKEFKSKFISTGDGGFQIFDNPLQALVFSLIFQANVKRYCSGGSYEKTQKKLYKMISFIELRYSITRDEICYYKSNFYGPAIINNARILSKDNLNRMLIDSYTKDWFDFELNAIENLIDIDINSFLKTGFFKEYDIADDSYLFKDKGCVKSLDILKIGKIEAKNTSLDIYNLHIQALIKLKIDKHDYTNYIVTVGNLNTKGIE